MSIEDLIERLKQGIESGWLDPAGSVSIRDYSITEEMMEAGTPGYTDLAETLIVDQGIFLLGEERY